MPRVIPAIEEYGTCPRGGGSIVLDINLPGVVEQLLVELHIAGHGNGTHGECLVGGTGSAVATDGRELVVNGKLLVGGIDGTRQIVAFLASLQLVVGHTLTSGRKEDGVAVLTRHFVARHTVQLSPFCLAQTEQLFKLISCRQCSDTACCLVGDVEGGMISVF